MISPTVPPAGAGQVPALPVELMRVCAAQSAGGVGRTWQAQRIDAIAEQSLDDERDGPERRIFPAAVGVGEKEAGCAVHREYGAQQNRRDRDRNDAGPQTRISAMPPTTSAVMTT